MRRTFMLQFPERIGVLLDCCSHLAEIGVNITRMSYNRIVDAHTLFLEADGTSEQLDRSEAVLGSLGYLTAWSSEESLVLFEFSLPDTPGAALSVLELAAEFRFAISYVSSRANGSGQQAMQLGLVIDRPEALPEFMERAVQIAPFRVVEYDKGQAVLDNTVFYLSFVNDIDQLVGLGPQGCRDCAAMTNQVMQILEERGETPYKTFEAIRGCASSISHYDHGHYEPRSTCFRSAEGLRVTLVEPPCGSNTCLIELPDRLVAVDAGLSCFSDDLAIVLGQFYPDFWEKRRDLLITHPHLDHAGGSRLFERVFASPISVECFRAEAQGVPGVHEESKSGSAFIGIYKLLAKHRTPALDHLVALTGCEPPVAEDVPFRRADDLVLGDLCFEVYAGAGGHCPGEAVFIERRQRLAFAGDVFVNVDGETKEQKRFNTNAAYLMSPVDADPDMAKRERTAFFDLLGPGPWNVIGGHGAMLRME